MGPQSVTPRGEDWSMTDQLVLIDTHPAWRLDSTTRERGIRGVARARQALLEARSKVRESKDQPEAESDDTDRLAPAA